MPHFQVSYLCSRRVYPLLKVQKTIRNVYLFEKDEWREKFREGPLEALKEFRHFLKGLKTEKFKLAFDLSLAPEFGFFSWLIGIELRLGYSYRNRGIFLNKRKMLSAAYQDRHMIEHYLQLLDLLELKPVHKHIEIDLPAEVLEWAEEVTSRLRNRYGLIISLIPGGGASWGSQAYRKLWSIENYRTLLSLIRKEIKAGVILLGDSMDAERFGKVKPDPGRIDYLGKTNLLKFSALISKSDLVVTNDGGPLHIAVGLSVPTLSIFGPVPERVYGPYPPESKHRVISTNLPCRPCYRNFRVPECNNDYACLKNLSPKRVFEELKSHLAFVLSEV